MFKKKRFCSVLSLVTIIPLFSCAANPTNSINYQDTKIDISDIITDTDMGEMQVLPSDQLIINFIYSQAQAEGYPDLVNDLNIVRDTDVQATISVIASSTQYTGSVEITWTLTDEIDIATIFTKNLTTIQEPTDLQQQMDAGNLNTYIFAAIMSQYGTASKIRWNLIKIDSVSFDTLPISSAHLGYVNLLPLNNSSVYTGSATLDFSVYNPTNPPIAASYIKKDTYTDPYSTATQRDSVQWGITTREWSDANQLFKNADGQGAIFEIYQSNQNSKAFLLQVNLYVLQGQTGWPTVNGRMIISDKSAFLTKLSAYDSTITSTSKINNISSIPYVNDTNATPIYNPTQYTFEDSTQIIHPDDLQQTTFITGDISTDKKQSDIFQWTATYSMDHRPTWGNTVTLGYQWYFEVE